MSSIRLRLLVGVVSSVLVHTSFGQPIGARVRLWSSVTQFPMQITSIPGQPSIAIGVDRLGRVRAMDRESGAAVLTGTNGGTVLDIRARALVQGDGGLMSAAFPSDFETSRALYVYYNRRPDFAGVLSRFRVLPGTLTADPNSEELLLVMPRPNGHNGGWIGFSPNDEYLYLSLGDAGTAANPDPLNRSQTIVGREFAGKILRLDVSGFDDFPAEPDRNYAIPPSNPFVGVLGDDEIWAYGLRNPWRCAFDSATGDLWIGDVGQETWEEVHFEAAGSPGGRNYGWRCMEHTTCTGLSGCACGDAGLTPALFAYGHDVGCSISPGILYRGLAVPALAGAYLYTDWCSGRIWALRQSGGQVTSVVDWTDALLPPGLLRPDNPVAICEDGTGEAYILDHQTGHIFKILPTCGADFNGDDFLDFFDYDDFVRCFESSECPPGSTADFNGDEFVDFFDYDAFVTQFEAGC